MRIAIGYFGQLRTFLETKNNIQTSFEKYDVDFYASTWEEEGFDVEKVLKKELNFIKIDVEKIDKKTTEGIALFGSLYPMLYKMNKAKDLIIDSEKKYDYIVLLRFDCYFYDSFPVNQLNDNTFYYGKGIFLENGQYYQPWKLKIHTGKNLKEIGKFDPLSKNTLDNKIKYENITDQIYVANPKVLESYLSIFHILENCLQNYLKIPSYKKVFQKKLYNLFSKILNSRLDNKHNFYIFKIYKITSKLIGFYTPFWIPLNADISSKFKPTLFSYGIHTRNIQIQELQLKYTFFTEKVKKLNFLLKK